MKSEKRKSKPKWPGRATIRPHHSGRGTGWKYDVILYQTDPGDGGGVDGGPLHKLSDGSLFTRLSVMGPLPPGHNSHAEVAWDQFVILPMRSIDRGLTWRKEDTDEILPIGMKALRKPYITADMRRYCRNLDRIDQKRDLALAPNVIQRTPGGTLVGVDSQVRAVSNREGEQWEKLGYHVSKGGAVTYIWDKLMSVTSTDGGRSWKEREITEIGPYSFLYAWGGAVRQGALTLPNGDAMGVIYGHLEPAPLTPTGTVGPSRPFVLRTSDEGKSWSLVPIPCPASDFLVTEINLVLTATGKLIAMMRYQGSGDCFLRQSESFDGGWTWSRTRKTPMWGYPPQVLQLQSGALLCVYGYRFRPLGCRACMSYDDGKTWDIQNEKILRDDSTDFYHGVSYPSTVLLDDGTLYTTLRITKPAAIGKERVGKGWAPPELLGKRNPYSRYMAQAVMGDRYTEDYVRPNGKVFWKAGARGDDPE